jgi:putative pyruvate formate lyase activating enzyme
MWKEHDRIQKQHFPEKLSNNDNITFSYLDLKIKIVEELFKNCILCQKRCEVNRKLETGSCGVKEAVVSSDFMHMGEEPPIIPSHTIFFSGCNFDCVFCQNFDISQRPNQGIQYTPKELARKIDINRDRGSKNVNFVGGDPTPNLLYILRVMGLTTKNIPVLWNSNMYLSPEAMKILDGFVDLYLTDFKYGNDQCALKLSGVHDYITIVGENHKKAQKSGDMIIRHLVLPNHVDCCSKPLLDWIAKNLGLDVVLNIMGQYHPLYKSHFFKEISRPVLRIEEEEVIKYAKIIGFNNIIN